MCAFFGLSDAPNVEDFNGFAHGSLSANVVPRWKRKQLSGSSASVLSSSVSTPSKKMKMLGTPGKSPAVDRFIPDRSSMDLDVAEFHFTRGMESPRRENLFGAASSSPMSSDSMSTSSATNLMCSPPSCGSSSANSAFIARSAVDLENMDIPSCSYASNVSDCLFEGRQRDSSKILAFKGKAPQAKPGFESSLRVLYTTNKLSSSNRQRKQFRHIASAPERILDAPDIVDDFYLNLLDWGSNNNLAVALGPSVYLWNATSGTVEELMRCSEPDNFITSVSWVQQGSYLAIGTNNADVQLWDAAQSRQLRSMKGHAGRVGSLAWNSHILSSGSRDSTIINHDVRIANHATSTLKAHEQEVCGLRWSPNGQQLASGGNDNLLNIWDLGASQPRFTLDHHQAAVKALAWCPHDHNILASGGGTADRMLRFWNTQTGACVNSIDTNSQVCSIVWNPFDMEVVTSHGFSQNQLTAWKYPSLVRMADLTGHTSRVLHMALSPDGTTVVSAAADETLRFWRLFDAPAESQESSFSDVFSKPSMMKGMAGIR